MSDIRKALSRGSSPHPFKIAQYWMKIQPHWVIDLGEPSCFRCRHYEASWDVGDFDVTPFDKLAAERCQRAIKHGMSKEIPLERAHIVAHMSGGSNDVSNFVMLCERCHRDAPMTCSLGIMVQWIDARVPSPREQFALDCIEEAKKLGTLPENFLGYSPKEVGAFADTLMLGSHGGRESPSTVGALLSSIGRAQKNGVLRIPSESPRHEEWFKRKGKKMPEPELYVPGTTTLPVLARETSTELVEIRDGLALIKEMLVTTDDEQNFATEILQDIKQEFARIEVKRKSITGPLNTALKGVNNLFKPMTSALSEAEQILKLKIAGYLDSKQAKNVEALELAAAASDAEAASEALSIIQPVIAPKGVSVRKVWKFRVVDASLLPREYLCPDMDAIGTAVQETNGQPIPGVEVFQQDVVTVRKT